ncbi:MAG: glycoside hydrolase family 43 protein [Bacteroidales bacterium]|nr:glycoside hydrolase family 43 protein [Bacteroidales bacterium]
MKLTIKNLKWVICFLPVILNFSLSAQNFQEYMKVYGGVDYRNPFAPLIAPNEPVTYTNPILPGVYPDPAICRVGEDYYLVTSTFEYFPGVPVFHSKDLVNWEQIGHCIDRKEQLPKGMNIFAPTISYHDGTFYMITTSMGGDVGNFYVTAKNPAGPWSDPVWTDVKGIDPSLFFDDDGKSYVISQAFILKEIDLKTGKILDEGRKIWCGTGQNATEGPHIYKKDGYYYLMAAEGGTHECHRETIARSHSIWGPYTDNPANPILTHANAAGASSAIKGVGHADIVQAHDGSYWMVCHGFRSVGFDSHQILGRETCLVPLIWPTNGWPVVNGNGTLSEKMTCPTLPLKPFPVKPTKTEFTDQTLGFEWNYIQAPVNINYSLDARKGFLSLKVSSINLGEKGSPTFVGRRLQDFYFKASTRVEFDPAKENEQAGFVLVNNGSHFGLMIKQQNGKRYLVAELRFGSVVYESKKIELKKGPVNLKIEGAKSTYKFFYSQGNDDYTEIQIVDSKFLSSETAGGFSGTYVGLYATGNDMESVSNANYDWFEYLPVAPPNNPRPFDF